MQGVGKTEFLKVPTLIDSDVVSLDLPHSLIVGLGGRDICAVIAWGLSRPCNPMAPKLKLYIDEEPYIIEEAKEDNGQ
jgi:hypothetical protein